MALTNGFKEHNSVFIQVVKPELDVTSVIKEITQTGEQEEPFYICDVTEIIRRHEDWKTIMPRVGTHYAVKCNDSRVVLETLAALGTGFDCASQEEIRKVLSLGVQPSRIIFANPTKKISHLKYAAATGVATMTFDNEYELHKIKKLYPDAKLLIRIKYDDLSARYILGQKYGCDHETEAPELLRIAAALNLDVVGVCFHIGSGSKDCSVYRNAIAAAKYVFDIAGSIGFKFKLLDIGGGFPGEKKRPIKEIGHIINSALEDYFPDPSIKITSEPGRYYVNTAFTLTSSIHSVKTVLRTDSATKNKTKVRMYYVDVGVYGALIPVLFDEFFTTNAVDTKRDSPLHPSIIWGPTCDTFDKISEGITMLPEMHPGEWLTFEEAGAYSLSIACEFNGFATPKIHSIINEDGWLMLTKKVPYPMSRDKFVLGNTTENFRTGLTGPNNFRTNYF